MDAKSIQVKLNTLDGWKAIKYKGWFATKPKKNLKLWQEMEQTDILPLYDIRRDQYEDNNYVIYAFSMQGEISQEKLFSLSEAVSEISLGAIRYEAAGYSGLVVMRSFQHTLDENDGEHDQISIMLTNEEEGLFVFVAADFNAAELDAPYVAYGRKGRSVYVYPLSTDRLQRL